MSYINYGCDKRIQFIEESDMGDKWLSFAESALPDYRAWFKQFANSSLSSSECVSAVKEYLPLFADTFSRIVESLHLDDSDIALLSFYCPAPVTFGCSQGVWLQQYPVLVRNFDYFPALNEGRYLKSAWHGTEVIASTDCLWGALDGMNEYGLSVSVTFVGLGAQHQGFAAPIVVRYILEFCTTTEEAVDVLMRIPLCMAYNFSVVDSKFTAKTVEVNPFTGTFISSSPAATNHQGSVDEFRSPELYDSLLRKNTILDCLYSPYSTLESFLNAFAYSPLYQVDYQSGTATLYTVAYNCELKAIEYRWATGIVFYQSFFNFLEADFVVSLPVGAKSL